MSYVSKILIINIVAFGILNFLSIYGLYFDNILALYPVTSNYFSPYQLITHLFIHGNIEHLFFNMFFLLVFGTEVEKFLGKKFLSFYLFSGIFSSGLYCLGVDGAIIGSSGAVFAVMSASIFISLRSERYKKLVSLKLINIISISLIILEFYYVIVGTNDNIGHWAHIFGSIFAIIYLLINHYDLFKKNS